MGLNYQSNLNVFETFAFKMLYKHFSLDFFNATATDKEEGKSIHLNNISSPFLFSFFKHDTKGKYNLELE